MQNFALIRIFWRSRRPGLLPRVRHGQAGYTLLELLVTVIIIGAIAAISVPTWLGFVQQRRVTAANDAVVRALQEAQSKAKAQKVSYSVTFRNPNGVPQVAVYKEPASPDNYWRTLGDQFGFKPGQIVLGTNLNGQNSTAGGGISYNLSTSTTSTLKITFDNTGALPTNPTPNLGSQGLIIAVAAGKPNSNPAEPVPLTRRCVKITTLLGSLQTGKIKSDNGVEQCQPN